MSLKTLLAVVLATAALGGCAGGNYYASNPCDGNDAVGTAIGAALGGIAGSQIGNGKDDRIMAGVAGAMLGGYAGHSVAGANCGRQMYR